MKLFQFMYIVPLLASVGCSSVMQPGDFADRTPAMLPMHFFVGHTHSWGIVETSDGEPTETFETDAFGTIDADGVLHWPQHLTFSDGKVQERDWVFRQTGEHSYEGTANDVAGTAHAEAYGNLFHLSFTLELSPGNSIKNVAMEEWMYRQTDGSVVNRVIVRKLGLTGGMVTEYFRQLEK